MVAKVQLHKGQTGIVKRGKMENRMQYAKGMVISAVVFLGLSACQADKLISYQPQVWSGNESFVSVTRPGMASSADTERVANIHCAQFGKRASLTRLASPLQLPNRDEFACVASQ
jgi:hypothetical protein